MHHHVIFNELPFAILTIARRTYNQCRRDQRTYFGNFRGRTPVNAAWGLSRGTGEA